MHSRPITSTEKTAMDVAATEFVRAIAALAGAIYPAMSEWPAAARITCVLNMAVSALLQPGVHGEEGMNLDHAAYAVGLALGVESVGVTAERATVLVSRVADGLQTGREQAIAVAMNMPTEGTA